MHLPARTNDRGDRWAMSPLRHGAFAKTIAVLPGESASEYRALVDSFTDYYKPEAAPENEIVYQLAQLAWRTRRLDRIEADLMHQALVAAKTPTVIEDLAAEVARMEVEAGILQQILQDAEVRQKEFPTRCADYLSARVIVLERLLDRPVAGSSVTEVLALIRTTLAAQNRVLESSCRTLERMADTNETAISAAQAEAVLLDTQVHDRLAKERVAIVRAQQRHIEMLSKARGGMNFDGELLVARARGHFSEATTPGRRSDAGQVIDVTAEGREA